MRKPTTASIRLDPALTSKCNLSGAPNPTPGPPPCTQEVSAVKAISIAAQAGQRIYTLTPEIYGANPSIVQSQLNAHSADTKTRVLQALEAGYEVTVHQAPITQNGWTGAGFTTIDRQTGAGGYLIEGGRNGGELMTEDHTLSLFFFGVVAELVSLLFAIKKIPSLWSGMIAVSGGGMSAAISKMVNLDQPFASSLGGLLVDLLAIFFFGPLPFLGTALLLSVLILLVGEILYIRAIFLEE